MKNPHAVALGKLGGKKGGVARAAALSPERRSEIARQGGIARWQKKCLHDFYYPGGGIAHCWHCDVELDVSELFVVPCEQCSAKPGSPCHTPNGTKRRIPHALRLTAFVDRLKGDALNREVRDKGDET